MSKAVWPEGLDASAAQSRVVARSAPPRVKIARGKTGWKFDNPYPKESGADWYFLLADAFGTRHAGVVDHFLATICELVPEGEKWVAQDQRAYWYPSEPDFNAVLAIIASLRPENECQAAHAAQCAALHLASMKVGQRAVRTGCERSAAILAKTSRAFGEGMERLARLQGKIQPKQSVQTIQVVYVDQRSVNQFNGGSAPNGGQAHATNGFSQSSRPVECRPALPSPRSDNGDAMPWSGCEGQADVPDAWLGQRLWRSLWGTKRKLEARRVDG